MMIQNLPPGLTARPARLEDAQAVTDLLNAEYAHFDTAKRYDDPALQVAEWTTPGHDLNKNSVVVEDENGRIVASADLWAAMTPPVRQRVTVEVHPDFYATGLRAALLVWAEARAHEQFDRCPADAQITVQYGATEENSAKRDAIEAAGYSEVRRFYQMRVDMAAPPVVVPLPPGYHFEAYQHPEQLRAIVKVDTTAFRDHFGYVETDFDEEVAETQHYFESLPYFDPSLFLNVIHDATGEMAAVIWVLKQMEGDSALGYIDGVAVLREHRGKGLALAMLTRALNTLYESDRPGVALHCDATNLTGALRLYEKAGMRPVQTFVRYEKVLRTGRDLVTR